MVFIVVGSCIMDGDSDYLNLQDLLRTKLIRFRGDAHFSRRLKMMPLLGQKKKKMKKTADELTMQIGLL